MRVWMDMANSPHPQLLAPISDDLRARGHRILVTTRGHAQTRDLTLRKWPEAETVGLESPSRPQGKAGAIMGRALGLRRLVSGSATDVAVSLNSYAQLIAARSMRIPSITLMDYEHQPANHIAFRLASHVVVPAVFPGDLLRRFGATPGRVSRLDGFKEELYLDQAGDSAEMSRPRGGVRVVLRPPPEGALYHQRDNASFERMVEHAAQRPDVEAVLLPRLASQRRRYAGMAGLSVPAETVDGLALLCSADLFIGAGGTMSREAALLGIPAYTMFAGRPSAVDWALMASGRLRDLRSAHPDDVEWLPGPRVHRADAQARLRQRAQALRSWLIDRIERVAAA